VSRRCSAGMGGTGGGRVGGGGTLLALLLDDVEPPRLLDMGKSAPPGIPVSVWKEQYLHKGQVVYSLPTSPSVCSISSIA
jgi:hypothetical protein